ncbi:MAG: hypothetical protein ACXVCY_16960 [Pseudobdellovibrionaceae bacterium]
MKKIILTLSMLLISPYSFAKIATPLVLSCFEHSMFTDSFANPINVNVFQSSVGNQEYHAKVGIYDPERNKLTYLTSSSLRVQKIENSNGNYSLIYADGAKSLALTIDENQIAIINGKILDKAYYWTASLKSNALEPIPNDVELICRHDGLWF